jgi:phage shock protein PspC (stress-responsive transcriptional regulator)
MNEQPKKLFRSRQERMIGGVAGGLGEYLNIDPTLMRLAFVILTFFGGSGIPIYLIMWLVIPESPVAPMPPPPPSAPEPPLQ